MPYSTLSESQIEIFPLQDPSRQHKQIKSRKYKEKNFFSAKVTLSF